MPVVPGALPSSVMLGARYLELDNELRLNRIGTFGSNKNYTDGVIIIRPSPRLSSRWRFDPTLSFGKGESKKRYELQPQFQYQFRENIALRLGYRRLYYDIESGNRQNAWKGSFQGFIIGVGGTFGG